ncbi:MAG: hemolysin family protein [Chlamydiales bacterium]|nr:hemolysin family protein [Chlamydiales bacterium]
MENALLLMCLVLFTLIGGLTSASEVALFSLSAPRIKAYRSDPDSRKRLIADLVLRPRELVVTLFMLNITVGILLQNSASALFGSASSWVFKVGVPLILMLLFGDILPKYIAINNNSRIAYAVAPTIAKIAAFLAPIRKVILAVSVPVSEAMFFFLKREDDISREEMHHVLKTSQDHGVLDRDEAKLINGYLDLQEYQVKELMRPRDEVLYYDIQEPISKLEHMFVDQEVTRIPICSGTLHNVLGILTADSYLRNREDVAEPADLQKFLAKPFYVPEATPARRLMRYFDERQEVMAIVVDEYGSVAGLITREDLVEVVVGDITDRRDAQGKYTRAGDDVIIASGKLELSEFEDIFGIYLDSPNNMVTLGGWLCEAMGDIPKSGSKYQTNDFLFQVLSSDPNRVRRIYVRRLYPRRRPGKEKRP